MKMYWYNDFVTNSDYLDRNTKHTSEQGPEGWVPEFSEIVLATNSAKSLGSMEKKISERNIGDLTSSVPLRTNICHLDSKVKGLQRVCL